MLENLIKRLRISQLSLIVVVRYAQANHESNRKSSHWKVFFFLSLLSVKKKFSLSLFLITIVIKYLHFCETLQGKQRVQAKAKSQQTEWPKQSGHIPNSSHFGVKFLCLVWTALH